MPWSLSSCDFHVLRLPEQVRLAAESRLQQNLDSHLHARVSQTEVTLEPPPLMLYFWSSLILQGIYAGVRLWFTMVSFGLIPGVSYVWAFLWAAVVLGINEIIRRQEIK